MRTATAVFIMLTCVLPAHLWAQIPTLDDVPEMLKSGHPKLVRRHDALAVRRSGMQARVQKLNEECSNVEVGSALEKECQPRQARFNADRSRYIADVLSFNRALSQAETAAISNPSPAKHPGVVPSSTERVGRVSAIRGGVFYLTANGEKVSLVSNSAVFAGQRIITDESGRVEISLKDNTVMSVGPHSDAVMDRFFYDDRTARAITGVQIMKGLFRFVAARTAKGRSGPHLKVDMGRYYSGGIRGTDVEISFDPDQGGYIKLYSGAFTITSRRFGYTFELNSGDVADLSSGGGITIRPRPVPATPLAKPK